MDISKTFENLATSYGWRFVYARRDYQNLIEATNFIADNLEGYGVGETVFFLDPVQRSGKPNEMTYQGSFLILTKSDLDDDYSSRVTKYIEPLIDIVHGGFEAKLKCDYDVNNWRSIEIINEFDFNGDGISVAYNIKGY